MNSCCNLKHLFYHPKIIQNLGILRHSSELCVKKKRALVFLPRRFEEIEVVTPVDILRRGGVEVTMAGLCGPDPTAGSQKIFVTPDIDLDDACGPYDAMILTGDKKAVREMCECQRVCKHLQEQEQCCRIIAAICNAPCVLMKHSIGKGKRLTSHPKVEEKLRDSCMYTYCCSDVVVDDYLITARGPAQAFQWALTILMHLTDEYNACCIARSLLVK